MFESKLNRGKAGGYAPLDTNGKLPLDKLSFNIGSYATTGSNSFFGNQTISGSLILKDGNVVNPTYTAGPYNIVDGNTGEIYFSYSDNPNLNVLFGEGDILIETDNSNRTTPIISITGDGSYWTVMADNSWLNGLTSNSITFSRKGGVWNFGKDGILKLNNGIAEIYADDDNGSVRIGTAGPNIAPNAQIILGGDNILKIKSGPPLREWTFNSDASLRTPGNIIVSGSVYVSSSLYVSSSAIIEGGYLILTGSTLPIGPTGSVGDREGMITFDKNFLYYCTSDYEPYIAPTPGSPGFTVTASGATHTYNPDGNNWNGYHTVGSDPFLQTGASQEGDGSIPPVAGWYFVDDNGNIRQLLNTPVWFSGQQNSPFPNGGGWLCVVDSNDWVYSDSNPTLTFHESVPTVNFEGGIAPSTGSLGSGEIWTQTKLNKTPNYAPFGSGSFDNPFTDITVLDITKDIHLIDITDKNDDSHFYLPNGLYDGQVVRFTLKGNNTNGPNSVRIWMDNLRTYNGEIQSNTNWSPFFCGEGQGPCRSLATALYIDGAWNIDTDWWDM